MRQCLAVFTSLLLASLAVACNYTIRDIGYVVFAPPKLKMVILFHERVDKERVRELQRQLTEEAGEAICRAWNVAFESGTAANLGQATAEQRGWERDSQADWSCWLVRDDGASRLLVEATLEQEPRWTELLEEQLHSPLAKLYRDQAMASFAQMILFEASDAEANELADKHINDSIEALAKAASLLPRPVKEPVKVLRVSSRERDDYASLLWVLHASEPALAVEDASLAETQTDGSDMGDRAASDVPIVVTLYGRGRMAGPALRGEAIQVEGLLSQLVLVGQSCECGTQRNWIQYPQMPLDWSEELQGDMTHHLGFDPGNAVVIEEVKQIIQRGPQNFLNGRDDVSDVVNTALSTGGIRNTDVKATVIHGDGWGFDEPINAPEPSGLIPKLVAIPPGREASRAGEVPAVAAASAAGEVAAVDVPDEKVAEAAVAATSQPSAETISEPSLLVVEQSRSKADESVAEEASMDGSQSGHDFNKRLGIALLTAGVVGCAAVVAQRMRRSTR